jgi:glycosyltransferase A (GT-A) superfamily protein (DUF2064 family)
MPWGTSEVMSKTRDRLRKLRLQVFEAKELWDIDTPADYLKAQSAGLVVSPPSDRVTSNFKSVPRPKTDP